MNSEASDDVDHSLRVIDDIEVYALRPGIEQFAALLGGPSDADFLDMSGVRMYFLHQFIWQADMEVLWQAVELADTAEDFQAGDNRHRDPGFATSVGESEVTPIVEKHLGDNIVGAAVDFLFEKADVCGSVRGFLVFLRIASDADAHTDRFGTDHVLNVLPGTEVVELLDEFGGINVDRSTAVDRLLVVGFVTANGQNVVYPEVIELNHHILSLLACKPSTEQMRDSIDLVSVLDDTANADRAGALSANTAFDRPIGQLFVVRLGGMTGDINERWVVGVKLGHNVEDVASTLAPSRWDDLVAVQGFRGAVKVLGNKHFRSLSRVSLLTWQATTVSLWTYG